MYISIQTVPPAPSLPQQSSLAISRVYHALPRPIIPHRPSLPLHLARERLLPHARPTNPHTRPPLSSPDIQVSSASRWSSRTHGQEPVGVHPRIVREAHGAAGRAAGVRHDGELWSGVLPMDNEVSPSFEPHVDACPVPTPPSKQRQDLRRSPSSLTSPTPAPCSPVSRCCCIWISLLHCL